MKVQINNITFNYKFAGSDALPDQDNLGIGHLIIPGTMSWRFAKEEGGGIIPHYGTEESKDAVSTRSDHECYNSDTQIVLMHWLFKKQRKYNLDYYGLDAFWLFHDSLHAKHDVWGGEVQGIWSSVEKERLISGAQYAYKNGVCITADTLIKLELDWTRRWRRARESSPESFNPEEFLKYMNSLEREKAEYYLCDPEMYRTPPAPSQY